VSASLTVPLRLVQPPGEAPYLMSVTPNIPAEISMRPGAFGVYCTDRGDPRPSGEPSSGEPSGGYSGSGSEGSTDPGPTAEDSSNQHSRCLPAHYNHEHVRNTITGEVNTSYDMTARYAYGYQQHHDSTISAMVKPPGSGWQAGGAVERRQGTGFEAITPLVQEQQSQQVVMPLLWLHEGDYRWESGTRKGQSCSDAEQAYPHRFRGDVALQPTPHDEGPSENNRCKQYDSGHRIKMQAGGVQRRFSNQARTFGWAGTWNETGYSARSGFSEDVWIRWRAGNNRDRYWLCGTGPSGFANWKRVFAGPTENL